MATPSGSVHEPPVRLRIGKVFLGKPLPRRTPPLVRIHLAPRTGDVRESTRTSNPGSNSREFPCVFLQGLTDVRKRTTEEDLLRLCPLLSGYGYLHTTLLCRCQTLGIFIQNDDYPKGRQTATSTGATEAEPLGRFQQEGNQIAKEVRPVLRNVHKEIPQGFAERAIPMRQGGEPSCLCHRRPVAPTAAALGGDQVFLQLCGMNTSPINVLGQITPASVPQAVVALLPISYILQDLRGRPTMAIMVGAQTVNSTFCYLVHYLTGKLHGALRIVHLGHTYSYSVPSTPNARLRRHNSSHSGPGFGAFEAFLPLCEIQAGLKKGEFFEVSSISEKKRINHRMGIIHEISASNGHGPFLLFIRLSQGTLSLNPRCADDSYISAPFISGNRFL